MPIMTALWRQGRRISEFLASLVYRARAVTQRSPVLKKGEGEHHTHTHSPVRTYLKNKGSAEAGLKVAGRQQGQHRIPWQLLRSS